MPTRGRYGAPLGACYAGVPWGASDSRAEAIAGAYAGRKGMSPEVAAAMVAVADRLGADAYDLANLINFESGWNPQARNPTSGATGLIQFMPKCLTEDTLALTPSGWKAHHELVEGDAIITYNSEKQVLELDSVKAVHVYRVDRAVRMWNKQFDFISTPNHRWYCRYRDRGEVRTTEELSHQKSLFKIVRAAPWLVYKETTPYELAFAELVGILVGDGSVTWTRGAVTIYQSPTARPAVCARIDELLRVCTMSASTRIVDGVKRWHLTRADGRKILAVLDTSAKLKVLKKSWVFSLAQDELRALRAGYVETDGHVTPTRGDVQFTQVEPQVMDDFQLITLLLGEVCNVRIDRRGFVHTFFNGHASISRDRYYTYLKRQAPLTEARANRMNYEEVEGPFTVWCPETHNQTWVAKRGGFVTVTGNTAANLGTTTDALYQLSALQQMPWVEKYLSPYRGKLGTVQGLYMAVFYPKAMTWSLDTPMPEIVRKANPGINSVGDYVRYANRRAKLPSSDSRGGRIVEAVAAVSPVVSYSVAAQSGALATRARDRYRSHRTPLLLLGTLGFGAVALLAIRARRGAAQSSPSPLPA